MFDIDKDLDKWRGREFTPEDLKKIIEFVVIRTRNDSNNSRLSFLSMRKCINTLESYLLEKNGHD